MPRAKSYKPFLDVERAELARLTGDEAARERELREAHRLFIEMGATIRAPRSRGISGCELHVLPRKRPHERREILGQLMFGDGFEQSTRRVSACARAIRIAGGHPRRKKKAAKEKPAKKK